MWLTVLVNLSTLCTVTGDEFDAEGSTTIRDWSYASKESSVYLHRRLGSNEAPLTLYSYSGVQRQKQIIEIGAIVAYILLALGILLIIVSWFLPYKTGEDRVYLSQANIDWESTIFRTESTLVPPIDEEEIQDVLVEYERVTAQLRNNPAKDFIISKSANSVFKNTRPVVTPFIRKSSTLISSNTKGAKPLTKPIISDDIFDEKGASNSIVNLYAIPVVDGIDSRTKDDKGLESPSIRKSLSFYMKEGTFEIFRNKYNTQQVDSLSVNTSPPTKRLSIQLDSVGISRPRSKESGTFQLIL